MFSMHAFGFLGVETHLWWFVFFNHVNLIIKCNLFTLCMFVLRSDWFNAPFTQFHIYSPFTQSTCILRDTMFVCLPGVIISLKNCSLILKRQHYWWRAICDLCSALMAMEKWGFSDVSHLPWHGPNLYNGHLRGPLTLTSAADHLVVEQSLPILTN